MITNEANAAVERILEEKQNGAKVGKRKYTHFPPEQRAKIAKYATKCGNTATVRHFSKDFPTLRESTMRLFKKQYEAELRRVGPEQQISHVPAKEEVRQTTHSW